MPNLNYHESQDTPKLIIKKISPKPQKRRSLRLLSKQPNKKPKTSPTFTMTLRERKKKPIYKFEYKSDNSNDSESDESSDSTVTLSLDSSNSFSMSDNDELDDLYYTSLQKLNLNKELKKELKPDEYQSFIVDNNEIIKKIEKQIANNKPTLEKILKSNMDFKTKCEAIEQLEILNGMFEYNEDYYNFKQQLNNLINNYTNLDLTQNELEHYQELEEHFKDSNKRPLKYKIFDLNTNIKNKQLIYNRYSIMENLDKTSSEYPKYRNWIEWTVSIPTNSIDNIRVSLDHNNNQEINNELCRIKQHFDNKFYGMNLIKEKILQKINNVITNPNHQGVIFAVVGPPGCGKTSILRELANVLSIPFKQISLGGIKDSAFLEGHDFTYEGSKSGIIVSTLKEFGCNNGIIFFDEFDKLSNSKEGKDMSSALLHTIDFTQNHEYSDQYLSGYTIDISKIWFVISMNNASNLPLELLDRITIINFPGYNNKERFIIAKQHLIKSCLESVKLTDTDVIFPDNVINYIMTKSGIKEKGVRKLKEVIQSIIDRINFLRTNIQNDGTYGGLDISFKIPDFKLPLTLTNNLIDILYQKETDNDMTNEAMMMYC